MDSSGETSAASERFSTRSPATASERSDANAVQPATLPVSGPASAEAHNAANSADAPNASIPL
jgi:hypothetical protein